MPPDKVTKAKETDVCIMYWRMYWPKKAPMISKLKRIRKPFRFKVGDRMRISHLRNVFTREYDDMRFREIFVVLERRLRGGLSVYRLKNYLTMRLKEPFTKQNSNKWTFVKMTNSKRKKY